MFVVFVTPKAKSFQPHKWKEGGEFSNPEVAEFHAKQIRKMKDLYQSVEIVPKAVAKREKTMNDMVAKNLKKQGFTEEEINDHLQMFDEDPD